MAITSPCRGGLASLNHNFCLSEIQIFLRGALDSSGKTGGGFSHSPGTRPDALFVNGHRANPQRLHWRRTIRALDECCSIWSNAMRTVLTLALLLALCPYANAAKLHDGKPRHATVYPGQTTEPRF